MASYYSELYYWRNELENAETDLIRHPNDELVKTRFQVALRRFKELCDNREEPRD